jgi:hypothetical protein
VKRFRMPLLLALLAAWTALFSGRPAVSETVGNEACLSCHREAVARNPESPHLRAPAAGQASAVNCESCHGEGAKHAADGDPKAIRSFKGKPAADVCGTCHQSPHVAEWKASRHAQVGVDCIDCHAVHSVKDPKKSCQECH